MRENQTNTRLVASTPARQRTEISERLLHGRGSGAGSRSGALDLPVAVLLPPVLGDIDSEAAAPRHDAVVERLDGILRLVGIRQVHKAVVVKPGGVVFAGVAGNELANGLDGEVAEHRTHFLVQGLVAGELGQVADVDPAAALRGSRVLGWRVSGARGPAAGEASAVLPAFLRRRSAARGPPVVSERAGWGRGGGLLRVGAVAECAGGAGSAVAAAGNVDVDLEGAAHEAGTGEFAEGSLGLLYGEELDKAVRGILLGKGVHTQIQTLDIETGFLEVGFNV